ncbi:hypothetical protein WN944_004104 [Citrus x changshan-huyou]|uniref:Uncharacterized protein n=1 Tax=Citrus x changshan-huyou TaxID=2935761 RepID=A0AAP0QG19_9ROSI
MPVRGNFGAKTLPVSTDDLAVNKMENDDTSIEFSWRQYLSPGRRAVVAPIFEYKHSEIWGDNNVERETTACLPKFQNTCFEIAKTNILIFRETTVCLPKFQNTCFEIAKTSILKFGETRRQAVVSRATVLSPQISECLPGGEIKNYKNIIYFSQQ